MQKKTKKKSSNVQKYELYIIIEIRQIKQQLNSDLIRQKKKKRVEATVNYTYIDLLFVQKITAYNTKKRSWGYN